MNYQGILNKVSKDTGLSINEVDKIYKAFWSFIRNSVQEIPFKEELTETEFLSLRPNFNIPSIGKLCISYEAYLRKKARFNYIRKLRNDRTYKD